MGYITNKDKHTHYWLTSAGVSQHELLRVDLLFSHLPCGWICLPNMTTWICHTNLQIQRNIAVRNIHPANSCSGARDYFSRLKNKEPTLHYFPPSMSPDFLFFTRRGPISVAIKIRIQIYFLSFHFENFLPAHVILFTCARNNFTYK